MSDHECLSVMIQSKKETIKEIMERKKKIQKEYWKNKILRNLRHHRVKSILKNNKKTNSWQNQIYYSNPSTLTKICFNLLNDFEKRDKSNKHQAKDSKIKSWSQLKRTFIQFLRIN